MSRIPYDSSSLPPSKGQKPSRSDTSKTAGPRQGSLGREGGGRSLMAEPDQVVSAKAAGCRHCGTELGEADHHLHSRYDKIELLARHRHALAASTRSQYRRRLDRSLDAIVALGPTNRHGQRLRKRYGKVRGDLFTFLIHPDAPPDNNSSERELRPTATYRKVTGGSRSQLGADLFASVRSVVRTATRAGVDAYAAILNTLSGCSNLVPG